MRMYHPDLPYTKAEGQETTPEAFRLAWEPKGWREWPPVVPHIAVGICTKDFTEDEEE